MGTMTPNFVSRQSCWCVYDGIPDSWYSVRVFLIVTIIHQQ